jgi:type IV pilus assembly protein PilN
MIRINLLQLKRKKKAKPLPSFVILGVFLVIASGLGMAFIYFNLVNEVRGLTSVKNTNVAKIEELKKKVKEVEDFEVKIKTFEERKKVIETLRKNQSVPVQVLNEISYNLADGVWLGEMAVKSMNISLRGYAFTNANVVEFVNNLKKSPLFTDVYLEESKETSVEKIDIYEFRLKCSIKSGGNG